MPHRYRQDHDDATSSWLPRAGLAVAPESGCCGGWGDAGETLLLRVGKALKGLPRYEQAGPE